MAFSALQSTPLRFTQYLGELELAAKLKTDFMLAFQCLRSSYQELSAALKSALPVSNIERGQLVQELVVQIKLFFYQLVDSTIAARKLSQQRVNLPLFDYSIQYAFDYLITFLPIQESQLEALMSQSLFCVTTSPRALLRVFDEQLAAHQIQLSATERSVMVLFGVDFPFTDLGRRFNKFINEGSAVKAHRISGSRVYSFLKEELLALRKAIPPVDFVKIPTFGKRVIGNFPRVPGYQLHMYQLEHQMQVIREAQRLIPQERRQEITTESLGMSAQAVSKILENTDFLDAIGKGPDDHGRHGIGEGTEAGANPLKRIIDEESEMFDLPPEAAGLLSKEDLDFMAKIAQEVAFEGAKVPAQTQHLPEEPRPELVEEDLNHGAEPPPQPEERAPSEKQPAPSEPEFDEEEPDAPAPEQDEFDEPEEESESDFD